MGIEMIKKDLVGGLGCSFLEAFGEAGEEAEVFGVRVEASLHAEVEDEVFVHRVVHATCKIGLVVILAGDADVF